MCRVGVRETAVVGSGRYVIEEHVIWSASYVGRIAHSKGERFAIRVKLLELVPEEYPFDD